MQLLIYIIIIIIIRRFYSRLERGEWLFFCCDGTTVVLSLSLSLSLSL